MRWSNAFLLAAGLILIATWESSWIPHYVQDSCTYQYETYEKYCPTSHIVLFSLRQAGHILEGYAAAITAVATGFIALFTWTIWRINGRQLKHAHQVERAYLWPGFGRHEPVDGGMKWFVTVTNTGRMAGVLQTIYYAILTEEAHKAEGYKFKRFTDREDVIPPGTPNPGQETGLNFDIQSPMICCGWIEYEDVFGRGRKQGWMHRLNLSQDSAGNWSNPLPGCYSSAYRPWEGAETN